MLDDNDIYTTDIDKQQHVEIARERSLVASNGSEDTPTHLDDLSNIESGNDDGADIKQGTSTSTCTQRKSPHSWRS